MNRTIPYAVTIIASLGLAAIPAHAHEGYKKHRGQWRHGDDISVAHIAPMERVTYVVDDDRYDYARVIDADPIVRLVQVNTPHRQCWDEETVAYTRAPAAPVVLGSIIGGTIGNQFGAGRGKDAATVAGALLGAAIAHDAQRDTGEARTVTQTRCRVEQERTQEERVLGYRVTYRYHGETYTTRMDHDPGERIRVRVAVDPVPDED